VLVRRATPADAPALAQVEVASWQSAYHGFFPDHVLDNLSVAERLAHWAPRLATASHAIWVSTEGPRVTGFIATGPSRDADLPPPQTAEITALCIHPERWDSGCGRMLCDAAFTHMRLTEAQTVTVWVLAGNVPARRFYEHVGFATDDARKDLTLYQVTLPEVRYRLSLR
jgi:ribosomal protein S18 acetylase RimI-like enzyme